MLGATVSANVIVVNVSDTNPTVSTVFIGVELAADEVCLTLTVSLLLTVQFAVVQAHPFIEYSHPPTDIGDAALMPVIVIGAEVITCQTATFA